MDDNACSHKLWQEWSRRTPPILMIVHLLFCFTVSDTSAQTSTNITSSGLNTKVPATPPENGVYHITGGTRVGTNLYHGLGSLDLAAGDVANFLNKGSFDLNGHLLADGLLTHNILARITDDGPSQIFGTLRTTDFGNASLFLLNPRGVVFGPTASLDIGAATSGARGSGSFYASTADYLRLSDGATNGYFYANPIHTDVLTTSPVVAFGFMSLAPGAPRGSITVHGSNLSAAEGQTIALVGGDVTIGTGVVEETEQASYISALNGKIRLASASSPGEFLHESLQAGPTIDGQAFGTYGVISLGSDSTMDLSRSGTGTVSIRGGEFVLSVTDSVLTTAGPPPASPHDVVSLAGGSTIHSRTTSEADGAAIDILTGTLEIKGASQIVSSNEGPGGLGGDINITATKSVTVSGYNEAAPSGVRTDFGIVTSGVFSGTIADGTGGALTINTPKLTITDSAEVATLSAGSGNSQAMTLNVGTLEVQDGGRVSTVSGWNYLFGDFGDGPGQAGEINIVGANSISVSGSGPFNNYSRIHGTANGFAGGGSAPIEINAPSTTITLTNGGRIETLPGFGAEPSGDITFTVRNLTVTNGSLHTAGGDGKSGNIVVNATGTVSLSGEVPGQPFSINNENGGSGGTGIIHIETGTLALFDRARILNSTFSDPIPTADAKISIRASDKITMTDASDIRVFSFLSDVGGLEIFSPSATLTNQASMNTIGQGTGNSGPITVNTQHLILNSGSKINSSVLSGSSGHGGLITIQGLNSPSESVFIDGAGSGLFSTTNGRGIGGDITAWSNELKLTSEATISARTTGQMPGAGNAGNILIKADGITISGGASITAASAGTGNAGTVTIQGVNSPAQSLLITGTNSGVFTTTSGTGAGGDILVVADSVEFKNGGTFSAKTTGTTSTASGGTITVQSDDIRIESGATITAASTGPGKAGNILIEGTASPAESIRISDPGSGLFTETSGTGAGGDITAWSEQLRLTNGSTISAKTTGQMPNAGDGGNILIKADDITISGGATITAASTGAGNAGTVTIQGANSPARSLLITGMGSGVFSDTSGTGAGGDLVVISESVRLTDDGTLSAATSGTSASAIGGTIGIEATDVRIENGALVTAASTGQGKGGDIGVKAARTFESNGGTISTAASLADAGSIAVTAGQSVRLENGATISTRSTGPGNAGDIFLNGGQRFEMRNSAVTAQAAQAAGGFIDIRAIERVKLENSLISTSVLSGAGNGGNIFIDPQLISLRNSSILAQAVFGDGGNITLVTPLLLLDAASLISASSQFGRSGQVQGPTSNLAGTVSTLPSSLRQAQSLQTGRCAALANSQSSSFLIAGRDAIPNEPGGWQPSPFALSGDGSGLAARDDGHENLNAAPLMAMAEGTVALRRLTPAGFLTHSFAESGSTGCRA